MPHHGLMLKIWLASPLLDAEEAGDRVGLLICLCIYAHPFKIMQSLSYKRRLTGQDTTSLGTHQTHTCPYTGQHPAELLSIWRQDPVLSTVPNVRSPHLTNFKSYLHVADIRESKDR